MTGASSGSSFRSWTVVPDFFGAAPALRRAIDGRFAGNDDINPGRFVWEYWHRPELFTYLRALPQAVFPEELLADLMSHLASWGRERLGCRSVYVPLLNCHLQDCMHNLHSDGERGPWAYVLSLTDWSRREFTGGETLVLDPARAASVLTVADYHAPVFVALAPHFNQLSVFDARLPHSVRRVEGVHDPVKARLALAGWFFDPGVVTSEGEATSELTDLWDEVHADLNAQGVIGRLVVRIGYDADGTANSAETTVDSLAGASEAATVAAAATLRQRLLSGNGPAHGWTTFPFHLEPLA